MQSLPSDPTTVDDFLENDAFRTWIREQRSEDRVYWQHWLSQHPEKRDLYEQAVATMLVLQGKKIALSDQHVHEARKKILGQLVQPTAQVKPLLTWHWGRWAAAAAVVIAMIWWQAGNSGIGSLMGIEKQAEPLAEKSSWQIVKNTTGLPLVVLLPDNSSVLLSSGSQLRYAKQGKQTVREVYLQGEGFFEVTKNPAKPFVVYTANLTTKVLGTSFQVRAFEKEKGTYVKVKTGKVSVTPVESPDQTVLLTKNEQLSLETKTDKLVKQDIIPAKEHSPGIINQEFTFEFAPVADIFAQLESSYNMPIRYDRHLLAKCTFTGQLNDAPFLEKIRLICLTIESTFEVVDGQVFIHSNGCH